MVGAPLPMDVKDMHGKESDVAPQISIEKVVVNFSWETKRKRRKGE